MAGREFYVIIEKDEDGVFVGEAPQLNACYSQGRTVDNLIENIKEVIQLCLDEGDPESAGEFVGIHRIEV